MTYITLKEKILYCMIFFSGNNIEKLFNLWYNKKNEEKRYSEYEKYLLY